MERTADLTRQIEQIRLPDREVFQVSGDGWWILCTECKSKCSDIYAVHIHLGGKKHISWMRWKYGHGYTPYSSDEPDPSPDNAWPDAPRPPPAARARVERFDRRGTEPFEPFEPFEFFQNRNFPDFFLRKFKNFRKISTFSKLSAKFRQNFIKI